MDTLERKRNIAEPVLQVLVLVASLVLAVYFLEGIGQFAVSRGLPAYTGGSIGFVWLIGGLIAYSAVKELGHLLAARVVGFRYEAIHLGPVVLRCRPGGGWSTQFSGDFLFSGKGYRHAIPISVEDLRGNWLLLVAAGPAMSLLLAMLGFLGLVSVAGTALAGRWEVAAFLTAICGADFCANLLPFGPTDGANAAHLILKTERGKRILAGLEASMLNDRVEREGAAMEPAEVLEARRAALEQLERNQEAPGWAVALQHIELAEAALHGGEKLEAREALAEAGKRLESASEVSGSAWFRYWAAVYETSTVLQEYTRAAEARQQALEWGEKIRPAELSWTELAEIRVKTARLWITAHDYVTAREEVRKTRENCPARGAESAIAVELLAVEAECALQLQHAGEAAAMRTAAIEVAGELPEKERIRAMQRLAESAVRIAEAGNCEFAQPMITAAIGTLEASAPPGVTARCRAAWAKALYANGELAEAKAVMEPLDAAACGFSIEIEALRAQLLLAENRPSEAVAVLEQAMGAEGSATRPGAAWGRSLRSWALYRSGVVDDAVTEARRACDELMPEEHPDAAPALLTLAVAAAGKNAELAEAYLYESSRVILETRLYPPLTKASRLTDLARGVVQVQRKDWAKQLLEKAASARA